mgnify:CR=1 FL=1
MVEAGVGFDVQLQALRIGNQQATALQHPHDAAAEGIEQIIEFFTGRRTGAVKGRSSRGETVGAVQEQHVQMNIQVQG